MLQTTSYLYVYQAPYPVERDDYISPLEHDKFRQIFRTFIIETMELYLIFSEHMNFTRVARCNCSCESRFCQNFKKPFDWLSFSRHFLSPMMGHRIAIGIESRFIPKARKKTIGLDSSGPAALVPSNTVLRS